MRLVEYRKFVTGLLSVEPAKYGLKSNLRKKRTMNLGHVMIGFTTEVGELVQCLTPMIIGATTLTEWQRVHSREELGDIGFYLVWLAKILHMKLPAPTKKIKLTGTPADNLMALNSISVEILDCHKKLYYGRAYDEEKIKELVGRAIPLFYGVCNQLHHEPPLNIMIENRGKLTARYPDGFNPENEKFRNLKKEAAAAKAATAGKTNKVPPKAKKPKAQKEQPAATA